jgi:cytochrome c
VSIGFFKRDLLPMKLTKIFLFSALCCGLSVVPAMASGDAAAGEKLFKRCKACHVVDAEKHKTGPHLVNIMGRTAGTVEGYKRYSKAIKASGIVWNEETLDGYLEKPKAYVKGTRMAFSGLRKEADRANVIAYLKRYSN